MTITVSTAVTALLFATFSAFAIRRGMTYLHLYQQEEYDSPRFFKWMLKKAVFDKRYFQKNQRPFHQSPMSGPTHRHLLHGIQMGADQGPAF